MNTPGRPTALALQPDGQIVVVGNIISDTSGELTRYFAARYAADGSLLSVGSGRPSSAGFFAVGDLALQPDGKIVASGRVERGPGASATSRSNFLVLRLNPDLSLDTGFGAGGYVVTDFGGGNLDVTAGVVVQTDGKIAVAGSTIGGFGIDFALARYNPDGSLDPSFGEGGLVNTNPSIADVFTGEAVVQGDGKIVVAGTGGGGNDATFLLARHNPDGTLDASFGEGGVARAAFAPTANPSSLFPASYGGALALQADGRIVVGGVTLLDAAGFPCCYDAVLARFLP